jgi:hypothetical protein
VIVAIADAEKPAVSPDGGSQCWPSSPVQPINRFVQIFRCMSKDFAFVTAPNQFLLKLSGELWTIAVLPAIIE